MSDGIVPLIDTGDESQFGGKAVQLGVALRHRLPVPRGVALSWEAVDAVVAGDASARVRCTAIFSELAATRVAVRSSAVGEDSAGASFAGQHLTTLGVTSAAAMLDAIAATW